MEYVDKRFSALETEISKLKKENASLKLSITTMKKTPSTKNDGRSITITSNSGIDLKDLNALQNTMHTSVRRKLNKICTKSMQPFILDTIRHSLSKNEYVYSYFLEGMYGITDYIKYLVKKEGDDYTRTKLSYTVTNGPNKAFYRFMGDYHWQKPVIIDSDLETVSSEADEPNEPGGQKLNAISDTEHPKRAQANVDSDNNAKSNDTDNTDENDSSSDDSEDSNPLYFDGIPYPRPKINFWAKKEQPDSKISIEENITESKEKITPLMISSFSASA